MGGDNGSKATVEAIKNFLKNNDDVQVIAVGRKEELKELEGLCEIVDAPDVVPMTAGALDVLRMKNSSMMVALNLLKQGKGDGVISCGSTGGFLASATITLKMLPGVKRAALVTSFPMQTKGKYLTVCDCGANNENNPEELYQFAWMGQLYSKYVCNIEDPRVYLLSNGGEDEKGSPLVKETNKLFREKNFPNFQGNIEAREAVLDPKVDVVVCDGFNGNIFLKAVEGTAKYMSKLMKEAFLLNLSTKIGYLFAKKGVKGISKQMDYKSVGGALLLGVNGIVVKAHGNSDAYGFESAMKIVKRMAKANILEKIKEGIAQ